jgi:3-oxoacyl-[acyl-carrier-protein] synthase-1
MSSARPPAYPISVVGVGARTALGLTAAASAAAVRAGVTRIAEHPYMIDKAAEPYMVAMDSTLEEPRRIERLFVLLTSALDEALAGLGLPKEYPLAVYLALPDESKTFTVADAQSFGRRVAAHLAARCQPEVFALPQGNAAGLLGLWRASEALRSRQREVVVVAGVDSHLDPDFLEALDGGARLMSGTNRWGYPPGEGAGALVLAAAQMARTPGLPQLAGIRAVGIATEANRIATEAVCVGEGLAEALKPALASLRVPDEKIDEIYCDINGERYRTSEWIYAGLRLPTGYIDDFSAYVGPADAWGDVGAATAPLLASLAIASAQRGYAKGARSLVWASSESGLRGAAVLDLPV